MDKDKDRDRDIPDRFIRNIKINLNGRRRRDVYRKTQVDEEGRTQPAGGPSSAA